MIRMNKTSLLTVAVIVLFLMNIGMIAFLMLTKPPRPEDGRGGEGNPKQIIIDRLHFDQDQVERYEALILQHRQEIRTAGDAIEQTKMELYGTMSSPDAAAEDSMIAVIGGLLQRIEHAHFRHVLAIKALCRPEQMKDFNEFSEELSGLFQPKDRRPR
jgi:protein CpxP